MNGVTGWISLVILVYLIIFPHELAHALAAKAVGFGVKRFEIGIPVVFRFKVLGTTFGLGPLPFGGLLDTEEEMEDIPRGKLFLVTAAGPVATISIAILLGLMIYVPQDLRQLTRPVVNHLAFGLSSLSTEHGSLLGFLAWELGVLPGLSKLMAFFWLSAAIGLSVGFGNLSPLPPFDGGWMAIAVIDFITGRRIRIPEKQNILVVRILNVLGILFLVYDLFLTQILW